jgi:ATP-binding cassette subfamily B protein
VIIRRRIPFIQQMQQADCGATCLAMVLAYHGRHVPVEELRMVTGAGRDGTDARALVEIGRWYGLDGQGFSIDIADLTALEPGAILHWEFYHFVVFERLGRGGVWIVDPPVGAPPRAARTVPALLHRRRPRL